MSINKVILIGNLTHDPELRALPSGSHVLNFSIAVSDRRKGSDGGYTDVPIYAPCKLFGSRAESLSKYLRKGSKVGIDGKLDYSQWVKDGVTRSKLEVYVEQIELLTPKTQKAPEEAYAESDFPF